MTRYRITIDVDTTDPDMGPDDLEEAGTRAVAEVITYLGTAYAELDGIEDMGT